MRLSDKTRRVKRYLGGYLIQSVGEVRCVNQEILKLFRKPSR